MPTAVYATAEEFKQVAVPPVTGDSQDTYYESLIARASRMIDLACGVAVGYFGKAESTASALDVYGSGLGLLHLPPYVAGSLTSVVAPDGYTLPSYIERDRYLVITDASGVIDSTSTWYQGAKITVTAKWGFEEVPDDIKQATLELAIALRLETDGVFMKLADSEHRPAREELPPRVKMICDRRRFQERAVAFV